MNMKVFDLIETIFNALGILIAVQDIYNWLGILLLVINIFSILFRGGLEIYRHIKNKDYDKINDELDNITSKIEEQIDTNRKEGK